MNSILPKTLPRFIWHFLKPYRWSLLGLILPMIYSGLHLSLEPYVLKLLIDRVLVYSGSPAQLVSDQLPLLVLFVGLGFILVTAWRVKDYYCLKILPSVKIAVIGAMFDYVGFHSHRYYQEQFAGNIANKIKEVSNGIEDLIETFREIFRQFGLVIIAALMMLTVHFQLALVLFVWAVLFITVGYLLSMRIGTYSKQFAETRSVTFGKIVDSISNQSNVRLFSQNRFERAYLQKFLDATSSEDRKLRWEFMLLWSVQGVMACLMLGLMLYLLLHLRSMGQVSLGDFAFVMWVAVGLIDQVWMLTETLSKLPQHIGTCTQGLSLISTPHEITDLNAAPELRVAQGRIQYQQVSFSHSKDKPLFDRLNVEIEPGSKVGLVGYSGSGKSSFVHLMVRMFNLDAGKIAIDGQDISQVSQDSLRKSMSFIPQDPVLFHRSLKENIRYGRVEASDEEVEVAAKRAHAHEFILNTPQGYDSLVGERGIKLSGGQRQRIAIARALLKNAPILILDEATSSLDSVTEKLIQSSLSELMSHKTALVIAHRLSTLLAMDRILVFDQGRIVETGTHQELLQKEGLYTLLWSNQMGGFLPEQAQRQGSSADFSLTKSWEIGS